MKDISLSNNPIAGLKPLPVWKHFLQLTRIPRPSHHEAAIQEHVISIAQSLALEFIRDPHDNILIRKSASPGMEGAPGVILQGHLDMVPQANSSTRHDFTRDPIQARIDHDWVTASGTTLGADNGIGVAAALAVLEGQKLKHGPLEVLFTSNEEDGMTGAKGLSPDLLRGEILLNLDSEEEGLVCIGCAGGANVTSELDYEPQSPAPELETLILEVGGLSGGHSGLDIHRGRGNANRLLARLLNLAGEQVAFRLGEFSGGNMRNAIPREAVARVMLERELVPRFNSLIERLAGQIRHEYSTTEPEMKISLRAGEVAGALLPETLQGRLLDAINACPSGVQRMSADMPDLVETSTNLSVVRIAEGRMEIRCLVRSSLDSARDALCAELRSLFRLAGAESRIDGHYPGWQPNPDSRLLYLLGDAYRALFGTSLRTGAIHAGLECGVIGSRYPALEMASLGPTIRNPHSPDERLHIVSVQRFWDLLVATLGRLE
ncbi:MAG: aminoacyl-histidine dipeptidase [Sedimenticola sp.]|nr:aminoacyl-histidine dipeptidase [Sedimenticola sp.]